MVVLVVVVLLLLVPLLVQRWRRIAVDRALLPLRLRRCSGGLAAA